MKQGYLSQYFSGVAVKRLSAVEADETRSNQHEYQATKAMLEFMGRPADKTLIPACFIYLSDEDEPVVEDASLTLYDSRKNQKHRSAEYRFYFPTTAVSQSAVEGDLLVIAKRRDGGILVVVAANASSISRQIEWLFGFSGAEHAGFLVKSEFETEKDRIAFASRFILESIGIPVEAAEDNFLEDLLRKFSGKFPTTREFSDHARGTLKDIAPCDDPDAALMAWMEREEVLFRTLERHLISDRLTKGFAANGTAGVDVEGFIAFSLSIQNRRKSRVGLSLENHVELLFKENKIQYDRTKATENKSKPDFLFPSQKAYQDEKFDALRLTMLGVKSTCKDRWRQVLAEADRISDKHLLTLEVAISESQTKEMASKRLQLVLPRSLHGTYSMQQQKELMDVSEFIGVVRERQRG